MFEGVAVGVIGIGDVKVVVGDGGVVGAQHPHLRSRLVGWRQIAQLGEIVTIHREHEVGVLEEVMEKLPGPMRPAVVTVPVQHREGATVGWLSGMPTAGAGGLDGDHVTQPGRVDVPA